MKVKKILYSVLLTLFASFFVLQPALALTPEQLEMFAENNIMFYDPEDEAVYDSCNGNSVAVYNGSGFDDYVWNYFATANIPGVSDHAEVIAGIMGNLKAESNYNPFDVYGSAYGIFQAINTPFKEAVEAKFGANVWQMNMNDDPAKTKEVIKFQLDYLSSATYNWNKSKFISYLDLLKSVTGEQGAAEYADLFLVTVERAHETDTHPGQPLESAIVLANVPVHSSKRYQGAVNRRNYAREAFKKYASDKSKSFCYDTVDASNVTILTDGLVTTQDFGTFPGADIYTGLSLYAETTEKIRSLNSNGDLRSNVVLAFDITQVQNNEEELNNLFTSFGSSKTVYFMTPTSIPESATQMTALVRSQAEKHNIKLLSYDPDTTSAQKAKVIITEFTSTKNRSFMNAPAQASVEIVGKLNENSDNIGCYDDPTTPNILETKPVTIKDIRDNILTDWNGVIPDGYYRYDRATNISYNFRLCEITNIKSGTAKTASSNYYDNPEYKKAPGAGNGNNYRVIDGDYDSIRYKITSSYAVVNSRVSGAFYTLAADLKSNFDIDLLKTGTYSTFRSDALQDQIFKCLNRGTNKISASDCSGYTGAASPHYSDHEAGYAIDFNLDALEAAYGSSAKVVDFVQQNYSGTCDSITFNWNSRKTTGRWDYNTVKLLCTVLKRYNLYFTVWYEDWHVAVKGS